MVNITLKGNASKVAERLYEIRNSQPNGTTLYAYLQYRLLIEAEEKQFKELMDNYGQHKA